MEEQMKEQIFMIAKIVREELQKEFPENQKLEKQCKRASILLHMALKKKDIPCTLYSGHVFEKTYENGHVWVVVKMGKSKYILDVALNQFEDLLKKDIPDIVFTPQKEAEAEFCYLQDLYGAYKYKKGDVREHLVINVLQRVENV